MQGEWLCKEHGEPMTKVDGMRTIVECTYGHHFVSIHSDNAIWVTLPGEYPNPRQIRKRT